MHLAADLDIFLTDFGVDVSINGTPCVALFDNPYGEAFGIVSGSAPTILLKAEVPVSIGDAVSIAGEHYVATGIEPDGTGLSRIRLENA